MYPPPPPPPPPPPYGYYYPPPPPPPPPLGPEPPRNFAMPVMIAAGVLAGILLLVALTLNGSLEEGRGEVRLANKMVFLFLICGAAGIVDSIRAIYGRWKSALSVGILHLVMGAGLVVIGVLLGDLRSLRLSVGPFELQVLGFALIIVGVLALCAIGQIQRYGAWKRARQGLPPE